MDYELGVTRVGSRYFYSIYYRLQSGHTRSCYCAEALWRCNRDTLQDNCTALDFYGCRDYYGLFEKEKIARTKSALDYEQRETLILELADETIELRWELMKEQAALLSCVLLGRKIDHKGMVSLLGAYKQLEQDFLALVSMGEESCYRDMLIERLGLTNWRIFDGGAGPEPA